MTLRELADLRQFSDAHFRNGERRTADLLARAANHIEDMEEAAKGMRKRIDRLVETR